MARKVTDLPEPDSPTMPSTSPALDVEVDAAHGLHDAVVGREVDARRSVDLEHGCGHQARSVALLGVEGVAQPVTDEVDGRTVNSRARLGNSTSHHLPWPT